MPRKSTYTAEQAQALLGPRGTLKLVTGENRLLLKNWLTGRGMHWWQAGKLTYAELKGVYNDVTDDYFQAACRRPIPDEYLGRKNRRVARAAEALVNISDRQQSGDPMKEVQVPEELRGELSEHVQPLAGALATLIGVAAGHRAELNPDKVRDMIREELSNLPAKRIQIRSPQRAHEIEGPVHPVFERVLKLVSCGQNVLLVGPAGCGKTTLAKHLAKALSRDFGMISGSAGVSESQLTGWLLPGRGGEFEYRPSEFVKLYERGSCVFLLDEYDAFEPNMLLTANAALDNGRMHIPHRVHEPVVLRGSDVAIVATANTYGTGADPLYAGRNQMDAASNDRFLLIEMDYDSALEGTLMKSYGWTDQQKAALWALRAKVRENRLARVVSTRAIHKVSALMATGCSFDDALKGLTVGWSQDDRRRAEL